ncbi:MAG: hypothetical protein K6G51_02190 [Sphaerochaetaceae bacterium]|nr:hypothetical protein [Sphaerochaetaceae bacterium]
MNRKLLAIIAVCAIALSSTFASHSIGLQFSPYAVQRVSIDVPKEYVSNYGWDAKVGYRYLVDGKGSVGVDFNFSDYLYDGDNYLVLNAIAKCGVVIPSRIFFMDFDLGAGVGLRIYDSETKVYPTIATYLGFGCNVNKWLSLTAGAELNYAMQFHNTKAFNSTDIALLSRIGAMINL